MKAAKDKKDAIALELAYAAKLGVDSVISP